MNFDFPVGETQRLQFGMTVEHTSINDNLYSAREITDFITQAGADFLNVKAQGLWMRTTLNHGLFPTAGRRQSLSATVSLPVSDLQFYRLVYNADLYYPFPFARKLSGHLRTRLGYGDVYGSTPTYPFYEHFFSGGFGSVRGFEKSTLGPKITDTSFFSRPRAGRLAATSWSEGRRRSSFRCRSSASRAACVSTFFVDAGNVFNTHCPAFSLRCLEPDPEEIRVTTGLASLGFPPWGPCRLPWCIRSTTNRATKSNGSPSKSGTRFDLRDRGQGLRSGAPVLPVAGAQAVGWL